MKFLKKSILGLSLLAFSYACSDDNDSNSSNYSPVEESGVIDTLSVTQIRGYYKQFLDEMSPYLGSIDINSELSKVVYPVAYTTVKYAAVDPFGKTRTLSGMVGYPVLPDSAKNKSLEVASLQHGTLSYGSQAPSRRTFTDLNILRDVLMLVVPSFEKGYILAMPDYFGYGLDEANLHYYQHRPTLAQASRALIESLPAYAKEKSLTVNTDTLFLMGYSEGGFATVATLKSFSENNSSFKNFVTIAGAGPYDEKETAIQIVQQAKGDSPRFTASYAWVVLSYNHVYKINSVLDSLFQQAIVSEVKKYIDNNNIMQTEALPSAPSKVFSPTLVRNLLDGTDKNFIAAFEDNDISNFMAKGSIDFVHGSADTWVPTFNTDTIYARMQRRGIPVTKTIVPGATHATAYPFFALKALSRF